MQYLPAVLFAGNQDALVVPVGVVQVWNTFFPDSHFDSEREPGKRKLMIALVDYYLWCKNI